MAWFKSKEEKERVAQASSDTAIEAALEEIKKKKAEEEQHRLYEKQIDEHLAKVIITPESQEQYERRVRYTVEVIDTGEQNKGVIFFCEGSKYYTNDQKISFKERLFQQGIEAIVNTNFVKGRYTDYFYGLPVARKKGGPYR